MDRQAAVKIIRDTLESPFDKGRFINLSKNLVKYLDESGNFSLHGNNIPDAYEQSINSYDRVGKYEDADGTKIDILIVRLKEKYSLEHARTRQRNFVAWYLKNRAEKDAALVAFVSPENQDWRFSLVRMDYNIAQSPSGKVKVETELTPARRYSFLVGENESSHTAQMQLLPILQEDERKPLLSDFEKAFNIEVVTKEFFEEYKRLYLAVKEELDKAIAVNSAIREDFSTKTVDTVNFAKKLMGQIVFLYFLQKKGWLGVREDWKWGDGDKRFLRSLFNRASDKGESFFNDYLEYLFYDALAKQERGTVDPAYYPRFNCKIPFLNGGLFDPIGGYSWDKIDITLPNELFSNNVKRKEGDIGTGILDVFDRYNFTVKEDEPLDKEVAVDPEMLGKVFENLLEVKDRKSKGTYYTPREIVHYMCQESLINYLDTALNTGEVPLAKELPTNLKLFGSPAFQQQALKTSGSVNRVPREDIEAFVRMGELAIEHDTRVESYGKETERYSYKLPESIRLNARLIDDKLAEIRVCDPAIGSGAFPVGLMTEIVCARNTLTTYLPDKTGRTNYNFKRHAIQNCLYGVDIDPGAVEIAKLRLWLSLVVDEEDIKQIQPLPNLDYKIVCGNSLLGVKSAENDMFGNEIERLKSSYFNETNAKKKQGYRKEIDQLIKSLTNSADTFDFEVYFSEVFHEKGGFDLVIANPPYGFHQIHKADLKRFFKENYVVANGSYEHYFLFYERSLNMMNSFGSHAFISPVTWLTIPSAHSLRKFILSNFSLTEICWFSEEAFETARVNTLLSFIQKTPTKHGVVKIYLEMKDFPKSPTATTDFSQAMFISNDFYIGIFQTGEDQIIIEKIHRAGAPLAKFAHPCSGYNPYEVGGGISPEGGPQTKSTVQEKPYHSDKKLGKEWKPEIIGRDLSRYMINISGKRWIKYGPWLSAPRDPANFQGKRILVQEITGGKEKRIVAAYYDKELYHSRDVIPIKILSNVLHPYYLLALINSNLMFWFHQRCNPKAQKALFPKILVSDLKKLPIHVAASDEQESIIRLATQIISSKNNNPEADTTVFERQIDRLVYELYGLTEEEIVMVEGQAK